MTTDAPKTDAHALVRTWLQDRDRRIWPWLDVSTLERLIAALGSGVDPLEGERVHAALWHTSTERGGCLGTLTALNNALNPIQWFARSLVGTPINWNYGTLVSDERIVVRDWLDAIDAPFAAIENPSASGSMASFFDADFLHFRLEGETHTLTVPGHRGLARFLDVVTTEAREDRIARDRVAPPTADVGDPTGAQGYLERMQVDDERARLLLRAIHEGAATGALTGEQGLELARKTALLHHMTAHGRGSRAGMWVTALRRSELLAFLESRVGAPQHEEPEDGLDTWTYRRDRQWAKAAVGSAILLAQGKLDFALPKGDLRVQIAERIHPVGGAWTGYRIDVRVPGMWQPMAEFESNGLFRLHQELLAFEAQILLRRLVLGPDLGVEELLKTDQRQVDDLLLRQYPTAKPKWFRATRQWALVHRHMRLPLERRALARETIPRHLAPPPYAGAIPPQVANIAVANAVSGILTFSLLSTIWCFGGVGFLMWLEDAVLAQVPGLDEGATTGVMLLGLIGQWGGLLVTGPLRAVLGIVAIAAPRSSGAVGWLLVALGPIGLVFADFPGALASLLTLWWLTRPQMREYLRG